MDKKKKMAIFIVLFMSFFAYVVPSYGLEDNTKTKGNLEYNMKKPETEEYVVLNVNDSNSIEGTGVGIVLDTVKPEITLNGTDIILRDIKDYVELGAEATDNIDGDISSNIKITGELNETKGKYEIVYSIKDSSNNENSIIRNVYVINDKELRNTIKKSLNLLKTYDSSLINKILEANEVLNNLDATQEEIDNINSELVIEIKNYIKKIQLKNSCYI